MYQHILFFVLFSFSHFRLTLGLPIKKKNYLRLIQLNWCDIFDNYFCVFYALIFGTASTFLFVSPRKGFLMYVV